MQEKPGIIRMRIVGLEHSKLDAEGYAELGKLYFQLSDSPDASRDSTLCGAIRHKGLTAYKKAIDEDPDIAIDFTILPSGYRNAVEAYQNLKSKDEDKKKTHILPVPGLGMGC